MLRQNYLEIPEVIDFVKWGSNYCLQWPKKHWVKRSNRSNAFLFNIQGIQEAYEKYYWRAEWTDPQTKNIIRSYDVASTKESLLKLTDALATSISNPALHAQFCCCVLDWGGVPVSKPFYTKNAQSTVDYHTNCHVSPGIFIPGSADDTNCASNKNMSSGITKVHALLSISSIAPPDSTGLVIYDTRVAAAFNDLVAQYCNANGIGIVPQDILFSCGSAKGTQSRIPIRVKGQKYPAMSKQSPGNWTRDAMRVSWLLDAMLQHENSVSIFPGLSPRERFLRAQMGLFMIGYDLKDCADNDAGAINVKGDETIE